jgi:hypothetical protein
MDGQAMQRWQMMKGASDASWDLHCQQSRMQQANKLMYWSNSAPQPPMQQQPMQRQRPTPRAQPAYQSPRKSIAYTKACNKAQKNHDERIKAKNKTLRDHKAQAVKFIKTPSTSPRQAKKR